MIISDIRKTRFLGTKGGFLRADYVLVSFSVKNSGTMDGEDVPQLYIHHSGTNSPIKELKAFQRIFIKKGATATVTFKVPYSEIQFWEEPKKEWSIFSDDYDFMVGSSPDDIKLNAKIFVVENQEVVSLRVSLILASIRSWWNHKVYRRGVRGETPRRQKEVYPLAQKLNGFSPYPDN